LLYLNRCVIDFPAIIFTIPPEIVFTYYAFLLGFLFPMSMITTFYVLVLIRLHKIRRKHRSELKERSHRKVTRIVLAVITAYFICWVPYWFLQIFITIDPLIDSLRLDFSILPANTNMKFLKELTHLTTIFGYANNCLNPVLYVFLSESFREEYILLLNCFHLKQTNEKNPLYDGISQSKEKKPKKKQRKSVILRKRREIRLTKVKHSVAIDDIPLEYRTLSFRLHSPDDLKRLSTSSIPNQSFEHENSLIESSSHADQRFTPNETSLNDNKMVNSSSPRRIKIRISIDPPHMTSSSPSLLDDGGVYCGE